MNLYLDTSALVSLFLMEARSAAVAQRISVEDEAIIISDFAAGEFAAAIGTNIRTNRLTIVEGQSVLANFDTWSAGDARLVELRAVDVKTAATYVRRFDLALLFPDALHIAACVRLGAHLITGDKQQGAAATAVGAQVTLV